MNHQNAGWLPVFGIGTLFLFFVAWAAMHDIAHGDEGTFEGIVLGVIFVTFVWMFRQALRVLPSRAKRAWLLGTGCLFALFCAGGISAIVRPKYPRDPMIAAVFLAVGVPVLVLIAWHLLREARREPHRAGE